jgi:hypothetical protein
LLPFNNSKADILQIVSPKTATTSGSISGSKAYAVHQNGAAETNDLTDTTFLDPPSNYSFEIFSLIGTDKFQADSRPLNSESLYHFYLFSKDLLNQGGSSVSNKLQFAFNDTSDNFSNRTYNVKVHLDSVYTTNGQPFDAYFTVPPTGTNVTLPNINIVDQATNGYVDISCRFLTNAIPTRLGKNANGVNLEALTMAGTTNTPQYRADMNSGVWSNMDDGAIYVMPNSNNFNSTPFSYVDPITSNTYNNAESITFSNLPGDGVKGFYRVRVSN